MKIKINAYAKLNLCLDILGKLDNGYHLIDSVFQSVDLFDRLTVTKTNGGVKVICNNTDIEDNICIKAAQLFFNKANISGGATIEIAKNIPVLAGLGGGSADCAAALRALNFIYSEPLSEQQLCQIAKNLGADVPFCLYGGTVRVGGIGEKLNKISDLPPYKIIVIKNAEKSSTKELYQKTDNAIITDRPNIEKFQNAIKENNPENLKKYGGNVFINAWGEEVKSVIDNLYLCGADYSALSGSGPTCFGIFSCGAEQAYLVLKEKYGNVFLLNPVKHGFSIEGIE